MGLKAPFFIGGEYMETTEKKKKKRKKYRRANGTGSVCKLKGRRRKPWVARITTGWETYIDKEGNEKVRQIQKVIGCFETETEAEEALLLYKINPVIEKAKITWGELYKEWSEVKFKQVSKSTADNYRAAWKYVSHLSEVRATEIRTSHFQKVIDQCIEEGKSRSHMEKIKALCTSMCEYGVQNDILEKNYGEFIHLPKAEKKEKQVFTDFEIKIMFEHVNSVPWVDTILIMIFSGMRVSEMLQLTRFNVDLENEIISGGLKTEAGKNRIIPINKKILPFIKNWYNKGTDYLITRNGEKISSDYYRKYLYYPTLEQLGIRRLTPHACRHTWATLMNRAGVDKKLITDIIGHTDYAFTANTYIHPDIERLKEAINKI